MGVGVWRVVWFTIHNTAFVWRCEMKNKKRLNHNNNVQGKKQDKRTGGQ